MFSSKNSVDVVADYILSKIDPEKGDSITPLKLQKLVYYCQVWHVVNYGQELFKEKIQAWAHGPVVLELYKRYANYFMGQAIDLSTIKNFTPKEKLSEESVQLIDSVWKEYGDLSGSELEELTHSEAPWKNAYGDTPRGGKCNKMITSKAIREFYTDMK